MVVERWRRCSAITRPDLTTEQTAPFPPPPPPFPLPPPPPRPLPPTIFPSPTIPNHHSLLFNTLSTYPLLPWNPLFKLLCMLCLEIPILIFSSTPTFSFSGQPASFKWPHPILPLFNIFELLQFSIASKLYQTLLKLLPTWLSVNPN